MYCFNIGIAMTPKKNAKLPKKNITFSAVIISVFTHAILLLDSCAVEREQINVTIENGAERIATKAFNELKIPKSSTLSFLATAT